MKEYNKNEMTISSESGQTIVELVVALGVLVVGVLAVLTLTISSQTAIAVSTGHLFASNLAREGIETARAIRDTNWLEADDWDGGLIDLTESPVSTAVPIIDYNNDSPTFGTSSLDFLPNDIISDGRLYISSDGFYNHSSDGTATNFYRLITITEADAPPHLEVACQVIWFEHERQHEITVEDWLYDWR
ncbi:hypothetical protein KKD19_03555 [Patescibacteria group bacterium]|nr:hypothetical protein [Patescibacteria group bacterium]MBU4512290.1 hypothetical protein [Patescibacteria group bacterium]